MCHLPLSILKIWLSPRHFHFPLTPRVLICGSKYFDTTLHTYSRFSLQSLIKIRQHFLKISFLRSYARRPLKICEKVNSPYSLQIMFQAPPMNLGAHLRSSLSLMTTSPLFCEHFLENILSPRFSLSIRTPILAKLTNSDFQSAVKFFLFVQSL